MRIYMVQVSSPTGIRYFDSFWAVETTAKERLVQLAIQIEAAGNSCNSTDMMTWRVRIITAQVEDAALVEPKDKAATAKEGQK